MIWAVAAALAFSGCNKDTATVTFFARDKTDVTIPPTVAIDLPFVFQSPTYNITELLALNSNSTSPDRVKSVIGDGLNVAVLDTSGTNLDFIKHITIYVYNETLGQTKLAEKTDVPLGLTSLDLDVNKVELIQYVQSGSPVSFRFEAGMRNGITKETNVRVSYRFKVKALLFDKK